MFPQPQYFYPFSQIPAYAYYQPFEHWQYVKLSDDLMPSSTKVTPKLHQNQKKTQQAMSHQDQLNPPLDNLKKISSTYETQEHRQSTQKFQNCKSTYASSIAQVQKPKRIYRKTDPQYEKEGRNANSNLLRMFFRRLQQILQSNPQLINTIITKHRMKLSFSKFDQWFQINKVEHRNYIRLPSIKRLFICHKSDKQQTKMMRILLQNFINHEAHAYYLTSKKVKKVGMKFNYKSFRNIFADISQTS